jgi:hypothetical protein
VFVMLGHTRLAWHAQAGGAVRVPADHAGLRGHGHHRSGAAAASFPFGAAFTLSEVAAGFTVDEVVWLTGMTVDVAEAGVMQERWILASTEADHVRGGLPTGLFPPADTQVTSEMPGVRNLRRLISLPAARQWARRLHG